MSVEVRAENTTSLASVKAIYDATRRAKASADEAEQHAQEALASAGEASRQAENALSSAQNAQKSADSALVSLSTVEDVVGVLNWITAHGTMTANGSTAIDPAKVYFIVDANGDYEVGGTRYSIVSEPKAEDRTSYYTLSVDESVQNYVATHVVVDTEGLWLIPDSGGNKVLIATGAGSSYTVAGTYIIGKVNGVDTVFAKFTTDGATMNATNSTQIAHLGYGSGNAESGTATAPYYTLGIREGTAGNYSVVEGKGNTINNVYYPQVASGFCSHAEGAGNTASGWESHAEGLGNTASGDHAHAEGYLNTASGINSHAEGGSTTSSGNLSHTQGYGTEASRFCQTALGTYNEVDGTGSASKGNYILIVGNGTADNARSNALTVDWNGNVNIPPCGKIINARLTNADSRETTPDLTPTGKRGITALLASSAMTTNRPGEGTIIHCEWDNTGGWNSQLFIADNDSGNGKPFVAVRGQRSGTWTAWDKLLAESSVKDYVTVQSQSTTSYGDGYWRWREWNSGKVEIWYHGSLTLTTSESDSNGVKRYSRWFNFPNSYSLYRCSVIVNGMQEGAWYGCGGTRDSSNTIGAEPTRSFQIMGYRIYAQPPTAPTNLNIYICGQKTV